MFSAHSAASKRRPVPDAANVTRHAFSEVSADGAVDVQQQGGLLSEGVEPREGTQTVHAEGPRINMVTAIRRTLEHELAVNPRVVVFGEDVGRKGGVHAATLGLQDKFGAARVFDTSLSEEGIIGRSVGMALAGLMPVPEIQFRKYADPAVEQLNDCGTMRWRTANRFAAPMVVRMPGGFFKCGDPWHSQTQRSAVRARDRLARRDAVERGGCSRPAALRDARQRSDDLLRASRDARRRLGASSVSRRRIRRAVRQGAAAARGDAKLTVVTLGRDGRALRARGGRLRASTSSCSTCAR